jgi:hypothetical protein
MTPPNIRDAARLAAAAIQALLELDAAIERGVAVDLLARRAGQTVSLAAFALQEVKPQIRKVLRGVP